MWCGRCNPLLHFHNNEAFVRQYSQLTTSVDVIIELQELITLLYFTTCISRDNGLRDVRRYDGKKWLFSDKKIAHKERSTASLLVHYSNYTKKRIEYHCRQPYLL